MKVDTAESEYQAWPGTMGSSSWHSNVVTCHGGIKKLSCCCTCVHKPEIIRVDGCRPLDNQNKLCCS